MAASKLNKHAYLIENLRVQIIRPIFLWYDMKGRKQFGVNQRKSNIPDSVWALSDMLNNKMSIHAPLQSDVIIGN